VPAGFGGRLRGKGRIRAKRTWNLAAQPTRYVSIFPRQRSREAPPRTAEVAGDLVFPLAPSHSEQVNAGICGHDRPTAAARCTEARVRHRTGRATPKWLVRTLPAGL